MNKTHKNKKKIEKNKTEKNNNNDKIKEELANICKQYTNTYKPFESKVEELFKSTGLDINSTNYNLEKEAIKDLKKAVSPSGVQPNDDYYSYVNERIYKIVKSSTFNLKEL
jgi:hypothetical protein